MMSMYFSHIVIQKRICVEYHSMQKRNKKIPEDKSSFGDTVNYHTISIPKGQRPKDFNSHY